MAPTFRPVQIAYHVPDPVEAAHELATAHGWGPFFLMEHIPLEWSRHRGVDAAFDHTSAYGQAGDIMVELITQHDDRPSAIRDLFAAHERGLHHVACFVDDLDAAIERHRVAGRNLALEAMTSSGVRFAMVDASTTLGHMIELYTASEPLRRFYAHVARAAHEWDGTDPVRKLRT